MIYNDVFNMLNNGQSVYLSTSLTNGAVKLLAEGATGIFESELVEQFSPNPQLVLLGAGHVSAAVCKVCAPLGFKITVVDDRAQFACKQGFPLADKIIVAPFDEYLSLQQGGDGIFYAVLTQGHSHDRLCLEYILKKPFAYVGMIGSHRKNQMVFTELLSCGFSQGEIQQVHAPIGIDISADTPAEIAISIAAQLIKVRRQAQRGCAFDEAVLHSLCRGEVSTLATICRKGGSAPRGVGAKMALLKNGSLVGTIGGGSGEASVLKQMQAFNGTAPRLVELEMLGENAKAAMPICGGQITVLISKA